MITTEKELYSSNFSLFTIAWACSVLFHIVSRDFFIYSFHGFLLGLTAVYTILRPKHVFSLIVLSIALVNYAIAQAPVIDNHSVFAFLISLLIINCFFWYLSREKLSLVNAEQLFLSVRGIARAMVIILYGYAILHKLNYDYINLELSCSTEFFSIFSRNLGIEEIKSSIIKQFSIYLSLFIESLIPILLLIKRTRLIGVFFGILFHFLLSSNGLFYNFSSMMFALFVLFLPDNFGSHAEEQIVLWLRSWKSVIGRFRDKRTETSPAILAWDLFLVLLIIVVVIIYLSEILKGKDFFILFWYAYVAVVVSLLASYARKYGCLGLPLSTPAATYPRHLFIWLALTIFNGLCPYVGLKTQHAFSMYSNLITEGNNSNHFFIPPALQLFPYQKDLVEIVEAEKEFLFDSRPQVFKWGDVRVIKTTAVGRLVPFWEFKANYNLYGDKSRVIFLRNGTEYDARHLPELQGGVNWFSRKLLRFRSIDKERRKCGH